MTLGAATALLAAGGSLLLGAAPKVVLSAPGHSPTIKTHWNYSLSVSEAGKPVTARLTAQIIDPIGGVHAVEFGKSTKDITNWAFKGSFSDFIIWPPDSRGIPLVFRVTLRIAGAKRVVNYSVVPRA